MAGRTFMEIVQDNLGWFPAGLIYAILECMLIICLFVGGFVSFFSSEFARFFGLKVPCLLCSRIDHRIIPREPDFYYRHSICDAHALEISFLAYCHVHRRLANVSRMCKCCLLSFAMTDNRTASEAYRSLIDILAADFEDDSKIQLNSHNGVADERGTEANRCTCCGEQLRIRASNLPRLLRMLSDAGDVPETPSTMRSTAAVHGDFHPLSHVQYRELRLTSDTESEAVEEDDETSTTVISENDDAGPLGKLKQRSMSMDRLALDNYIVSPEKQLPLLPGSDSSVTSTTRLVPGPGDLPDQMLLSRPATIESAQDVAKGGVNQPPDLIDVKMMVNIKPNMTLGKLASDASKISAALSPRLSMLRKRLSMKRNDVGTGSFKGSTGKGGFSRGEGESLLHRLKRQVRLDRKSLIALCAELDQERSASAVAANQAMAMINRLQEEKASVQMEALQYQRMMEEQAEYDQEALQTMKKLLTKRENQIKALGAELKAYRERFTVENMKFEGSDIGDEMNIRISEKGQIEMGDGDVHPTSRSSSSASHMEKSDTSG